MNLHRLDGTGVVSDMKLPGIPLFRDDRSLYMVDYGPGGRRDIGFSPFTIVSVPVLAADGRLSGRTIWRSGCTAAQAFARTPTVYGNFCAAGRDASTWARMAASHNA